MRKITMMLGAAAVCCGLYAGTASVAQAETVVLQTQNRVMLSDWIIAQNKGCPVGTTLIAKEHLLRDTTYRCAPNTTYKTVYYSTGASIPATVTYTELPEIVVKDLPAPQTGYRYVTVDNNVYLLDTTNRTVIDGVTIVSPAN